MTSHAPANHLTFAHTFVLFVTVAAVSWCTSRLIETYRKEGIQSVTEKEASKQIDELRVRVANLERNCKP